ncbi:DUF4286 family protein [Persicimonas caeni]|uniref:DUF4286 family protein n=1 Tax=Persicimonas caeni TaxID=2292766 RepID=A0A4Y6PQP4_PERCE|nr:DUF4286 family protein [Persicimonas caeni]QDG50636.1 DUF4286 family protein [Persicimonas caeni]QED31857.1 DUF4286 family protein [Persicimonas caeni]
MLYTVYIKIDTARCNDWETWMQEVHIPDVLDTGCFAHATLARNPDADTDTRRAYRVVYRALSDEAFDTYQKEHAPQLQKEHTERYEGAFEAWRDVLPVIDGY